MARVQSGHRIGNHVDSSAETWFTNDMTKNTLPTVRFDKSGDVSAADAARISECNDGFDIYVLHPQGGRIYISHEPTRSLAEMARDSLTDVLVAWAKLSQEGGG